MEDENCFNCGAKNPDEEDIYYKYYYDINSLDDPAKVPFVPYNSYKKASTITICIECGAAWNAITLAAIMTDAVIIKNLLNALTLSEREV
jgi:ribosomal protein L40E